MLIELSDYERIYKTINSVLLNENALITKSCMFFSIFGASILSKHYGIEAKPVCGEAAYHLGNKNTVLAWVDQIGNKKNQFDNPFHCWVLAEGWLIDFMAPVFPQLLQEEVSFDTNIQAKMLQKSMSDMVGSSSQLTKEGDFYLKESPQATQDSKSEFSKKLAYEDLSQICNQWYVRPPQMMRPEIPIYDNKGNINTVKLIGENVLGMW